MALSPVDIANVQSSMINRDSYKYLTHTHREFIEKKERKERKPQGKREGKKRMNEMETVNSCTHSFVDWTRLDILFLLVLHDGPGAKDSLSNRIIRLLAPLGLRGR